MKKAIILIMIALMFVSCADEKRIDGVKYQPYGLLNRDSRYDESIKYEVSAGSVILSVIFIETIIIPVYLIGFRLYEPVNQNIVKPNYDRR